MLKYTIPNICGEHLLKYILFHVFCDSQFHEYFIQEKRYFTIQLTNQMFNTYMNLKKKGLKMNVTMMIMCFIWQHSLNIWSPWNQHSCNIFLFPCEFQPRVQSVMLPLCFSPLEVCLNNLTAFSTFATSLVSVHCTRNTNIHIYLFPFKHAQMRTWIYLQSAAANLRRLASSLSLSSNGAGLGQNNKIVTSCCVSCVYQQKWYTSYAMSVSLIPETSSISSSIAFA